MSGKVLLAALDNLGDLVFASSLIAPLRRAFPGGVGLWTKDYAAGLAPFLGADTVFSADPYWDRSPARGKGSLLRWLGARRGIAASGFEAAVVSSLSWKVCAWVASCGIPRRIGFGGGKRGWFLNATVEPPRPDEPVLSSLARLLGPLGAGEKKLKLSLEADLFRSPDIEARCSALPREPFAALHPFAGDSRRTVPVDAWMKLAGFLKDRGFRILWIGASSEARVLGLPRPGEYFSRDFGEGSLPVLSSLLLRCSFMIGHDSGPLHLAAALGLKTAGVFAPGEPLRTFPQGEASSVLIRARSPAELSAEKIMGAVPPSWLSAFPAARS